MIKKYALTVDGDVFYLFIMDTEHEVAAKWVAALESNVTFVNVDNYSQIRPGYLYNNGNLYAPDDFEMSNPLPELPTQLERNQYAGIVGNDVVGMLTIDKAGSPSGLPEMIQAGMASNPTVIEYTGNPKEDLINIGWTYDGSDFYPPQGE